LKRLQMKVEKQKKKKKFALNNGNENRNQGNDSETCGHYTDNTVVILNSGKQELAPQIA